MDKYLIYIALGLVIITSAVIIYIVIRKKTKKSENTIDISMILALIDADNVIKVEYIRNKIVLSFKDITMFNVKGLHKNGATGINVVGDKVKFFVEGSNDLNESIYYSIKDFVEGK